MRAASLQCPHTIHYLSIKVFWSTKMFKSSYEPYLSEINQPLCLAPFVITFNQNLPQPCFPTYFLSRCTQKDCQRLSNRTLCKYVLSVDVSAPSKILGVHAATGPVAVSRRAVHESSSIYPSTSYTCIDTPLRQNAMQIVRSWVVIASILALFLAIQATWAVQSLL